MKPLLDKHCEPSAEKSAHRLPPALWIARCLACWYVILIVLMTIASFASLELQWRQFLSIQAVHKMGRFIAELLAPQTEFRFLTKLAWASLETLAMSLLGTLLAVGLGLMLALPGSKPAGQSAWGRSALRFSARSALNALRSIPELIWASLLLIAAGLGPMAGTLALALHTSGVLGRLFADSIENTDSASAQALRASGVSETKIFFYVTLAHILPQSVSYTLYRWENNIRAAAVLGVVGAGGLGAMLSFHMSLFQLAETSSVLLAMLGLVVLVDALSDAVRRRLS